MRSRHTDEFQILEGEMMMRPKVRPMAEIEGNVGNPYTSLPPIISPTHPTIALIRYGALSS